MISVSRHLAILALMEHLSEGFFCYFFQEELKHFLTIFEKNFKETRLLSALSDFPAELNILSRETDKKKTRYSAKVQKG